MSALDRLLFAWGQLQTLLNVTLPARINELRAIRSRLL